MKRRDLRAGAVLLLLALMVATMPSSAASQNNGSKSGTIVVPGASGEEIARFPWTVTQLAGMPAQADPVPTPGTGYPVPGQPQDGLYSCSLSGSTATLYSETPEVITTTEPITVTTFVAVQLDGSSGLLEVDEAYAVFYPQEASSGTHPVLNTVVGNGAHYQLDSAFSVPQGATEVRLTIGANLTCRDGTERIERVVRWLTNFGPRLWLPAVSQQAGS